MWSDGSICTCAGYPRDIVWCNDCTADARLSSMTVEEGMMNEVLLLSAEVEEMQKAILYWKALAEKNIRK